MAQFSLRIAFLCCLVVAVWGERNTDFCEVIKESCGLIPPPLPTNFVMQREVAINKSVLFETFYFDNINRRAKYVVLSSGIERHHIFDYDVEQIISYDRLHPGVNSKRDPLSDVCIAKYMAASNLKHVFGFRDDEFQTKRSKMYNAYEMLRFGGEYQYKADGTESFDSRGLTTNKFSGCIYDAFADATLNISYFFSNEKLMPAGGTDGYNSENTLFMSIPLAARVSATKSVTDSDTGDVTVYEGAVEAHMPWFKGDPEFGYETFQIPPWMYCEGYKGANKKMPALPEEFATRIEAITFTQDQFGKLTAAEMLLFDEIYYSYKKNLARRDFTPIKERDSEIFTNFQNWGRVKQIFDYNVGVLYTIHKTSGRCFARAIANGDYFETTKEFMYEMMVTPEEYFLVNPEKQEYKGKYFVRSIETDAWAGKDEIANMTFYRETYISTNGWHEEADETSAYSIPVRQNFIVDRIDDDGMYTQTVTELNYFKFKARSPPLVLFNTDGCMETLDHKLLFLKLSVAPKDEIPINTNKWAFYQAAQTYIADMSGIGTPLRVQKLELLRDNNQYFLMFAFMAKAIPFEKGLSMDDAVLNLQSSVLQKRFELKFTLPGSDEVKAVTGSYVIVLPGSRTGQSPPLDWKQYVMPKPVRKQNYAFLRADEKVEEVKGMSAGGLAGLSIAMLLIGIAVGVALMYLYIRRYEEQGGAHQFQMKG